MNLLFENPWPLAAIGGLTIAILIGGFLQTQSKRLLLGAAFIVLLIGAVFVVERMVVTPTEEVADTLHEIAADLEVNNIEGVVRHIASTSPHLEWDARSRLRGVTLERVKIKRNLEIEVAPESDPRSANARFNCVVIGTDNGGTWGKRQSAFFLDVNFKKEQGSWRVASYEMKDPRAGLRRSR